MSPAICVTDRDRSADTRRDLTMLQTRIARQRDALVELTTRPADCDRLPVTLARILEVTSRTLNVERVSIWRYDALRTSIECIALFNAAANCHESGMVLEGRDFPIYFNALGDVQVIAADDAIHDPRTFEFADCYLKPLGISSMMDVPIHQRNSVIGVLCHEHTGPARAWTEDEKAFALGVANLISLAFERCERHRAESTTMLQAAALNAAADAIVITDRAGTIVWANAAFSALSGYTVEEALGRNPRDLVNSGVHDDAFFARMWTTLLNGEVWRGELTNRRKDGSTYVEQETITPVRNNPDGSVSHFVAIKRDLTEQRQLQDQFLQAQKMEVVGRLAGGIAHDFNNMLTVINGFAELLLTDLAGNETARADVARIQEAGKRAASLTRQLLTFSRRSIAVRQPLEMAKTLSEFRGILQRLIGEDIDLQVSADTGDTSVVADPSQIEQIVLNLSVNARDAMPYGGTLRVHASIQDEDLSQPAIRLTVADTGNGIAADILPRIFEPFFTTKEVGKGTGLGLATVYAIVEQLSGTISVASTPKIGTTFTIVLPAVRARAHAVQADVSKPSMRGTGHLLLVEDDPFVRDLAGRALESAGYTVCAAAQAEDALNMVSDKIDLLITDVVLPGLGGRELAAAASALRPRLPVLYTSGYTDDTVFARGAARKEMAFLPKPYTPRALLTKVREMLAASGERS